MKKAWVLNYPLSAQRGLWSESSLGAQSLCWICHVAAHIMFNIYHSFKDNTKKWIKTTPIQQHVYMYINWATSWENLFMQNANNKDAAQPAHPRNLIRVFVIHCLDSVIPIPAIKTKHLKTLATFWSTAGRFESYLVANPGFLVTRLNSQNASVFIPNASYIMDQQQNTNPHKLHQWHEDMSAGASRLDRRWEN